MGQHQSFDTSTTERLVVLYDLHTQLFDVILLKSWAINLVCCGSQASLSTFPKK